MVKVKKMNESAFDKLVKEFNAVGEFIRTKQDEKQSVVDGFDSELARCTGGHISKDALASSVRKVNSELVKLDKGIRSAMIKVDGISKKMKKFVAMQVPIPFKASMIGVRSGITKRKKKVAKKVLSKKSRVSKTTLAKELKLDRKFSK